MSDSLTRNVKASLKMQYYSMNDSWLNECIEYYISEHNDPSESEVLAFVVSQWQLSDLREINNENGCLPGRLAEERCTELSGKYILQMNQMYDIATSKYSQLERIRNVSNDNVKTTEGNEGQAWEPRKKRMIQFNLTDGVQDIKAIEYEPIRFLKDILPGYKLMIVGPVVCRRGVLLLKESNVLEIGGEVESLLIRNAMENILARALHLEENPDPYNDNNRQNDDDRNGFFEDEFEINIEELTQIERLSQDVDNISVERQGANVRSDDIVGRGGADDLMVLTDDGPSRDRGPIWSNADYFTSRSDARSATSLRVLPKERVEFLKSLNNEPIAAREEAVAPSDKSKSLRYKQEAMSIDTEERSRGAASVTLPSITLEDDFQFDDINDVMSEEGAPPIDHNSARQAVVEGQEREGEEAKRGFPSNVSFDQRARRCPVPSVRTSMTSDFASRGGARSGVGRNGEIVKLPLELTTNDNNYSKKSATTPVLAIGGKRTAAMVSPPAASPPKVRCIQEEEEAAAFEFGRANKKLGVSVDKSAIGKQEVPSAICDFICDVVKEMVTDDTTVYRTVRGKVVMLNKLSKRDSSWQLAATITDDTASIDVTFSSEVLECFLGFTVKEFSERKRMLKTNPEIEDQLRKSFRAAENKLKKMDALMVVELLPDKNVRVIDITELTDEQKVIIEKRVKSMKL